MKSCNKLNAFTLIEMLIVMGIMLVLLAIGASAFSGLRASTMLNEASKKLQQDIRQAQRSALLLNRAPNEKWPYGIGVDLTSIYIDGKYRVFKWCSPFPDYDVPGVAEPNTFYATSKFPNYNPSLDLPPETSTFAGGNGSIPISTSAVDCSGNPSANHNGFLAYSIGGDGEKEIQRPLFVPLNSSNLGLFPTYILFESVSGKAFLYNKYGVLLNYNANGTPKTTSKNAYINIVTPDKKRGVRITVNNVSGKVSVATLTSSDLSSLYYYNLSTEKL